VPLQLGLRIPAIPGISGDNEFGDVHETLVIVTLALVALHVGAALYNQFVDRGPVAGRMWPFRAILRD
jgi:cytochrome b561